MPNSKILICKGINLDPNYLNVLDYGEEAMLTLCQSKAVYTATDYQFIRETGKIKVKASYALCKQSNYIAFQNPDYSNKWTFAFITGVDYVSDSATEISFEEDFWSTWKSYWSLLECYVIREHAANDTIGANIVPENIAINDIDYEMYQNTLLPNIGQTFRYCVAVNDVPSEAGITLTGGLCGVYGGTPTGYAIYACIDVQTLRLFTLMYKDEPEKIVSVFLVPTSFFASDDNVFNGSIPGNWWEMPVKANWGYSVESIVAIGSPTFGGYTPQNNKLKTYPYCFSKLVNNLGSQIVFAHEKFNGNPTFKTYGSNNALGGSITYCTNYKLASGQGAQKEINVSINANPSGGWSGDSVSQWQANNGISTAISTISSLAGSAVSAGLMAVPGMQALGALGLSGSVVSAGNTIGNLAQQASKNEHMANPTYGGANNLNLLIALGSDALVPRFESFCINAKIAKIIDDYFTKYGYATKEIKTPNISGHANQNYVQVQGAAIKGDLPGRACDKINEIFNRGVHIWHSHSSIGDF